MTSTDANAKNVSVDQLAAEIDQLEVTKDGAEMSAAAKKRAKKKAAAKSKGANVETSPKDQPIMPMKEPSDEGKTESPAVKLTPAELKKIAAARGKKKVKKGTSVAQAAMAAEKAKAPKPIRHRDYEDTWDPMNCELGGGLVHDD